MAMAFLFRLEMTDGAPAEPPSLATTVPNWRSRDEIPLGRRTLRVVFAFAMTMRISRQCWSSKKPDSGFTRACESRPLVLRSATRRLRGSAPPDGELRHWYRSLFVRGGAGAVVSGSLGMRLGGEDNAPRLRFCYECPDVLLSRREPMATRCLG
jgi:hypothetical protein